jgi:hypothetical protein
LEALDGKLELDEDYALEALGSEMEEIERLYFHQ